MIVLIIVCYLLGSIPFAVIIAKLAGIGDITKMGSGNPGATNVARSGNKKAAILTLLGDALKGWLPVWLALQFNMLMWVVAGVGLAVFFGHLYPIYYKFKGGKGVATALGVMMAVSPWLGLACILAWGIMFAISRISSLAALMAAALSPAFAYLLLPYKDYVWMVLVMAIMLFWRHRTNIQKLMDGTESSFKKK